MTTTNIDLFEKPLYTVHVNGLFGVITKASVTEKITGGGIFEQIREGSVHHYNRMSEESLRELWMSLGTNPNRTRGRETTLHIQDEAGQFPTLNMDGETFDLPAISGVFIGTTPDDVTNRLFEEPTQEQLLQTQLRNGDITMFEYLDAISEL